MEDQYCDIVDSLYGALKASLAQVRGMKRDISRIELAERAKACCPLLRCRLKNSIGLSAVELRRVLTVYALSLRV
jgi:hypothetical protein